MAKTTKASKLKTKHQPEKKTTSQVMDAATNHVMLFQVHAGEQGGRRHGVVCQGVEGMDSECVWDCGACMQQQMCSRYVIECT